MLCAICVMIMKLARLKVRLLLRYNSNWSYSIVFKEFSWFLSSWLRYYLNILLYNTPTGKMILFNSSCRESQHSCQLFHRHMRAVSIGMECYRRLINWKYFIAWKRIIRFYFFQTLPNSIDQICDAIKSFWEPCKCEGTSLLYLLLCICTTLRVTC